MRSAVVTGASTGIGRATAMALKDAGFVVFAGVRNAKDAKEAEAAGLDAVRLDVTKDSEVATVAEHVLARTNGRLDLLVNNAGIATGAPVEVLAVADLDKVLQVNVVGLHRVTQAFLPALIEAKGRIVNIGSIAGRVGMPIMSAYVASKHAVEGYSDSLRREVAHLGVKVAIIEPGPVATPIWDKAKFVPDPDRIPQRYHRFLGAIANSIDAGADGIPPEDVAKAVLHAATASRPRARYPLPLREFVMAKVMPALPEFVADALVDIEFRRIARR